MSAAISDNLSSSGRATSIEAFYALLATMSTPEGVQTGLNMKLGATDCVISPFGKCGTTWLQQMAHSLRTRGDLAFDDISRVVPWLETSTDLGLDLNAPQRAAPRLFKSHLDADRVPGGGRYIIACRDPKDAAYSMFNFMQGWFIEPGSITLDEFVRAAYLPNDVAPGSSGGNYWTHLKSWWPRRHDSDVLFMAYEHMKEAPVTTIRQVAAFLGIALDDELLAITEKHSSLAFMQAHETLFDDKLMRERSMHVAGLAANVESSKVRTGQVGHARRQMSEAVAVEMGEVWRHYITKDLGFEDYASMIATLEPERRRVP